MQTKKSKLQQLRESIIADIKAILEKHNLDEMDLTDCGSTPVIWPSADDQDFDTYTLDRVYAHGVNILVNSSSSDNNRTDNAMNLATDTLVEILEFLEDNENTIWEKDEEEIPGFVFTVNDSGKKVKFAPGNLYWDGKKFCFENHQYDYPSKRKSNHIGHFFWSKNADIACIVKYDDKERKETDTFFATNGRAVRGWTVLSASEWKYIFKHSLTRKNVCIHGKKCTVLAPDGFNGTIKDTYTAKKWIEAETAYGLVALPLTGCRVDSEIFHTGAYGGYWSSSPMFCDKDSAYKANLNTLDMFTITDHRYMGSSIRLVSVH